MANLLCARNNLDWVNPVKVISFIVLLLAPHHLDMTVRRPSLRLSVVSLSDYLSVSLSDYLSVRLSVWLSISSSVSPSVYLIIYLFKILLFFSFQLR